MWDVKSGSILSDYRQQHGKLLTCTWSMLDADLVYTGSDDFSLHCWRPSLHIKTSTVTAAASSASNKPAANSKPASAAPEDSAAASHISSAG